jgi:multidrug efflux system membrane fusion protein
MKVTREEGKRARSEEGRSTLLPPHLPTILPSRFLTFLLCMLLFVPASCRRAPTVTAPAGLPVVPVVVAQATAKTVPVQVQAVGQVQPYATVSVKSRVDGLVTGVYFKDGQYVTAGELLVTLDATPYEAVLKQAQATRAKDQAQLENALKQEQRNAAVVAKGYVSKEQYDQAVATARAAAATVKADDAAIETARLQVEYCRIYAPISGRTGATQVDVGNLIKANDPAGVLVVIDQVQPIYVNFYVPQNLLPEVRQYMAAGPLPTQAVVPGHENRPAQGQLTFVNNTVNTASGTIQLRATFANENRWLWPGQFVNVTLTLTSLPNAVVVPSQAVQTGQKGEYVFVIKPDMTAQYRPVTIGPTVNGETVIARGVQPGETVVTDGQLRLSNGTHVRIVPPVSSSSIVEGLRSSFRKTSDGERDERRNRRTIRSARGPAP